MTTAMGPPPPRTTTAASAEKPQSPPSPPVKVTPMSPPPTAPTTTNPNPVITPEEEEEAPKSTTPTAAEADVKNSQVVEEEAPKSTTPTAAEADVKNSQVVEEEEQQQPQQSSSAHIPVPYKIPPWSEAPCHHYSFEVLKDGIIVDQFDVYEKGAYMFGRVDLCDFILEHPTISRFHAVLQFNKDGGAYLYDLSSTHGTFINKNQVKKKVYVELHVGDVIRFGHSSRLYIFQGPSELMPLEKDLAKFRKAKVHEDMNDMEASLRRAKLEASLADGVSWGMDEDAIEENEDDIEEITWQTYKGQLTEKQEKTREKVLKRLEKVANMKKEIDAIRVKDIAQGGLTQGQQTQIARNEQRILQIVEELENLEETLNDSIRESLGARSGSRSGGKKKGIAEDDEDEYMSDDDEFYDRAKKKTPKQKGAENQSIETADSLLDKKETIIKEMEDKKKLLSDEKGKVVVEVEAVSDTGDALDAYMSGLSSQLVLDKTKQLQKELQTLETELDRILYLLKIADPTGEAARKRESKAQEVKPNLCKISAPLVVKKSVSEQNKTSEKEETVIRTIQEQGSNVSTLESSKRPKESEVVAGAAESKTTVYTAVKPQRLGAVEKIEVKQRQEASVINIKEPDEFVDYKDRQKVLGKRDNESIVDLGLQNAAGLLIRKRKLVEKPDLAEGDVSEHSSASSIGAEIKAEDAVALLLKHTRGYHASDDEARHENELMVKETESGKGAKKPKKILGPERPSFLGNDGSYDESWVPPEGQSGDGRTSLNDRYGY